MSAEPAEEQLQPRRRERADWRSAEWNLALHWQEPANPFDEKTFSPATLGPQGRDKIGMAAIASEGTAPKDGTGKSVRLPAASTLAVDTNSRDTFGRGIEGAEANRTASDLDPFRPIQKP